MSDSLYHGEPFPVSGYVRPVQVAGFLKVSVRNVWRYAKRPGFPRAIKQSYRVTLFDAAEIRAWVAGLRD